MTNQITFNIPSINSVLAKQIGIGLGVAFASLMLGNVISGSLKASAITSGEQAVQTARTSGEAQIASLQAQYEDVFFKKADFEWLNLLETNAKKFAHDASCKQAFIGRDCDVASKEFQEYENFLTFAKSTTPELRKTVAKAYCQFKTQRGITTDYEKGWTQFFRTKYARNVFAGSGGYYETANYFSKDQEFGDWASVYRSNSVSGYLAATIATSTHIVNDTCP
jgi:hypothetical protein